MPIGICFEPLEPRLLLSGSWGGGIDAPSPDAQLNTDGGFGPETVTLSQSPAGLSSDALVQNQHALGAGTFVDVLANAPVLSAFEANNAAVAVTEALSTSDHVAPATGDTSANSSESDSESQPDRVAAAGIRELVFVNENIADYQQLIANLQKADDNRVIEVVVLDADRDGIAQISEFLADRADLAAVHVITHGTDGKINLGNTWLNSATLQQNSAAVAGWGHALSETGDLLFYGCNIAADSVGQSLLNDIADLTGADVAASDDLTGSVTAGGDWVLEYENGEIETDVALRPEVRHNWYGVLATFTVDTTADSGPGSLRQAIADANANGMGMDTIAFNIAGAGSHTIVVNSELPQITTPMVIDGSSQPGYSGKPLIRIERGASAFNADGLTLAGGSDGSTIRGLSITGFTSGGDKGEAIDIRSDNNTIVGNYLGVAPDGDTVDENRVGVNLSGGASGNRIGGTTAADRNVISGSVYAGVHIRNANTDNNRVIGNIIGMNSDSDTVLTSGTFGVLIWDLADSNIIGGINPEEGNRIAGHREGVVVDNTASSTPILGNEIFNNREMGIDLNNDQVTYNDADDSDSGPNDLLNYPVITDVQQSGPDLDITFSLDLPAGDYRIEFFENPDGIDDTGYGEGKIFLKSVNVTSSGIGSETFTETLVGVTVTNTATVVATATEDLGGGFFGSTSEFSPTSSTDATILDQFNTIAYDGNDGTVPWSDDWQEIGEADGANSGNVAVATRLIEQGLWLSGAGNGARRRADLSGANTAVLSFDYALINVEAGKNVVLEISDNGGGSWAELDRFEGPADDGSLVPVSYDISAYAASDTRIQFRLINFNGNDEFFVDNVQITLNTGNNPGMVTIDNIAPALGNILTASVSDADGASGAISYQWQRDSVDIVGATTDSYTTVLADVGAVIRVIADYTDDLGTAESLTSAGTAAVHALTTTYYLDGVGDGSDIPTAALKTAAPVDTTLDNFDPGRDAFAGLMLAGSDFGVNEIDTTKYQQWLTPAGGTMLNGPASLSVWSAMMDFDTTKAGSIRAYLIDSDAAGSSLTEIANATITRADWDVANTGSWIEDTFDFGNVDYALAAGRYLGVKIVVNNSLAADAMWLAYDVTTSPSRLTVTTILNDAPVFQDAGPFNVAEGASVSTTVGDVNADDGDGGAADVGITYAITANLDPDGDSNRAFAIDPNTGVITVNDADDLDYENLSSMVITVEADDGVNTETTDVSINIDDVTPTLSVSGAATIKEGELYTLNFSAVEPGTDAISSWTINWGDGAIETFAGSATQATHVFTNAGFTNNIMVSAMGEGDTVYYLHNDLFAGHYIPDAGVYRIQGDWGAAPVEFATEGTLDKTIQPVIGPDGNLYVSGESSRNVLRYNTDTGAFIDVFAIIPGQAGGIAFGPDGNLYVADYTNRDILRFNGSDGSAMGAFATGIGGRPYGLTFGPDGNLYVGLYDNAEVLKYDGLSGTSLGTFISAGAGGLGTPEQIVFGPDGNLYIADVANNKVLRFNGADGTPMGDFVADSEPHLDEPNGLAFGPDGNLYVSDAQDGVILRFDGGTGAFIDEYANGLDKPSLLAFAPDLQVHVTANAPPTLSSFIGPATSGDEDSEITVTFGDLVVQGNENDADGTVDAFVVKAVTSGTLRIGADAVSATAWVAGVNDTLDATTNAYWTSDPDTNGILDAFEVVAKDNDGAESTTNVTVQVTVNPINDAPVIAVPATQSMREGATLVFSALNGNAISVGDVDAGSGIVQVTLAAANGTLNLSGTAGLTFVSGTGTGDASMSFTGTLTSVNAALNGLGFTATPNAAGGANLDISVDDLGNTGAGGAHSASAAVPINIAGFFISPTSGLLTGEGGGTASFNVVLRSAPTADVTVAISSSDTSEGSVSVGSLTFTTANWDVPQMVTVTGVDDFIIDGDVGYNVITGAAVSSDGGYGGLNPVDVSLTNVDNSFPGITVSPTSGLVTTEAGGTTQFSVVLATQPFFNVVIPVSSSDTGEGTVSVSSLTFTAGNWLVPQVVTVTGVSDFLNDGNVGYTIILGPATSFDINYNGRNPADVSVINQAVPNAPPVNTVPGPQSTPEDTALVFSIANANAISVADPDAGTNPLQLSLTVTTGRLTLASVAGLTFNSGANGTGAMTFTGTAAQISAALNGLQYVPNANTYGPDILAITTDDLGNTGTGGARSDSSLVAINVLPVNDAPTTSPVSLTAIAEDSGARTITQAELLANAIDIEGDVLTATDLSISAGNGTLLDNGDGTWTYTPAADDDTAVSFTYSITDGTDTVGGSATLDITPVNDAPDDHTGDACRDW